jgi:hypothetical protein
MWEDYPLSLGYTTLTFTLLFSYLSIINSCRTEYEDILQAYIFGVKIATNIFGKRYFA